MKKSRFFEFKLIFGIYLAATITGIFTFRHLNSESLLMATFWADIAATVVIWLFGIILNNSSLYDPYWSVAPLIIIPGWILTKGKALAVSDYLLIIAVFIWGIRLTLNWANRWSGLEDQDWRYTMLKEKKPGLWFIINLFGINIMPTLLVFFAMLPAYINISSSGSPGIITLLGFMICISAAIIQLIADREMESFKIKNTEEGKCIDEGLWHYSRHPNYFGEVLFWWGIWIMQMGITPEHWKTIMGPLLINVLFIFISIPMMEEHILTSRPSYSEYKKNVSRLIPWFRKS